MSSFIARATSTVVRSAAATPSGAAKKIDDYFRKNGIGLKNEKELVYLGNTVKGDGRWKGLTWNVNSPGSKAKIINLMTKLYGEPFKYYGKHSYWTDGKRLFMLVPDGNWAQFIVNPNNWVKKVMIQKGYPIQP